MSTAGVYAEVIGDPIAQSKSPLIHGFWLERLGIDGDYRASRIMTGGLPDFFARRRSDASWRGCNVTIPHKQAVPGFCDEIDEIASSIGAVNTIWRDPAGRLCGTNTDIEGVREAIAEADPATGHAVVLGAGGAARAAFAALGSGGWRQTRILARDATKAREAASSCGLSAQIEPFEAHTGAFARAALVINATQLGMTGQNEMPAFVLQELAQLSGDAVVFDMVYAPLETRLLSAARALALTPVDGLAMLIGQAARGFELFFGNPAPRDCDAELREKLLSL